MIACLIAALIQTHASAIVRRHDVSDAQYQAAGRYPAVCELGGAMGTLIRPRWILTAAHVAEDISPFSRGARFGTRYVTFDRIVIHPDFLKNGIEGGRDLALIQLTVPPTGIDPIPIYRASDERGKRILLVGNGMSGDGRSGPKVKDGQRRIGLNRIDEATKTGLVFAFDAPPYCEPLEAISGPGDSGGPAIIVTNGKPAIAGVSSTNSGEDDSLCRYGTIETYARVSSASSWIAEVIGSRRARTNEWSHSIGWATCPSIVRKLVAAYNLGSYEAFQANTATLISSASATSERQAAYSRRWNRYGVVRPREVSTFSSKRLSVLAFASRSQEWIAIEIKLQGDGSQKVTGWSMKPGRPPNQTVRSPRD